MTGLLIEISIALAVVNVAVAALVVGNRFIIRRSELRYAAAVARTRPVLLDWIDGEDVGIPQVRSLERRAFVDLLAKYGRSLRGDGRKRVAEMALHTGLVTEVAKATSDRRGWRRAAAAYRLGDIGGDHHTLLIPMLNDPDRRVRNAAARSLGKQGSVEGVAPIVVALSSGAVARAVGGQALIDIGSPAAGALGALLESHVREIRSTAAELLGRVGTVEHARILVEQLRHPDPEVRVAVVRALGRLGGRVAASALVPLLHDPIPYVRAATATSIGQLGRVEAIDALLAMAGGDSYLPAHAAAHAAMALDPDAVLTAAESSPSPHLHEVADLIRMA
ncbi:MAG: HEAT repeat domain-containing protein [Acidimicrobiia bacterium]